MTSDAPGEAAIRRDRLQRAHARLLPEIGLVLLLHLGADTALAPVRSPGAHAALVILSLIYAIVVIDVVRVLALARAAWPMRLLLIALMLAPIVCMLTMIGVRMCVRRALSEMH